MKVVRDDLSLCHDCHFAASGEDETIVDQDQAKRVEEGLIALGIHLVPDYDSESGEGVYEFSWRKCDCCGSSLGGTRHRYAVLGGDS